MATPPPTPPRGPISPDDLTIVPANQASWADLSAIFGTVDPGRCNCQWYKTRGWFWAQGTDETRRAALREQTNCDDPQATSTTGLVGYLAEPGGPGAGTHVGSVRAYADAGFREVSSPSVRRVVMRVDF